MRSHISLMMAGAATVIASLAGASTVEIHLPVEVCELILKDPEIVEYFHVDVPGRLPIVVDSTFLPPEFSPQRLDYPIKAASGPSSGMADAFRITRVDSTHDRIVVEFQYPLEGLRGRFTVVRKDEKWVIKKRKLWEM